MVTRHAECLMHTAADEEAESWRVRSASVTVFAIRPTSTRRRVSRRRKDEVVVVYIWRAAVLVQRCSSVHLLRNPRQSQHSHHCGAGALVQALGVAISMRYGARPAPPFRTRTSCVHFHRVNAAVLRCVSAAFFRVPRFRRGVRSHAARLPRPAGRRCTASCGSRDIQRAVQLPSRIGSASTSRRYAACEPNIHDRDPTRRRIWLIAVKFSPV